jgi:hypothetical protein
MSTPVDLSVVETKTLLNELLSRFDAAAFVAIKVGLAGPGSHQVTQRWSGAHHPVLGLLADEQSCVQRDLDLIRLAAISKTDEPDEVDGSTN